MDTLVSDTTLLGRVIMSPVENARVNWSNGTVSSPGAEETYVCWSRMQAEAGQPLETIIRRKETERRAGNGLFFWGVGNPPSSMTNVLARLRCPVEVVFSIMKTRPKAIDVAPDRTVVWRRYFDAEGSERALPASALVTSRGDSATGAKKSHYALVCRSNVPLQIERGTPFDPAAFRNAGGAGAPVGASQVTALLRRTGEQSKNTDYEANLRAWLTDSYWVRLSDPLELDANKLMAIADMASVGAGSWLELVSYIRRGASGTIPPSAELRLF